MGLSSGLPLTGEGVVVSTSMAVLPPSDTAAPGPLSSVAAAGCDDPSDGAVECWADRKRERAVEPSPVTELGALGPSAAAGPVGAVEATGACTCCVSCWSVDVDGPPLGAATAEAGAGARLG